MNSVIIAFLFVIPAKAGIQDYSNWIPARVPFKVFAGMTPEVVTASDANTNIGQLA